MATTLVKNKLKAAREAITAKDWTKAELSASDALTFDASNYNARVFLAVAQLNLGKHEESEAAYKAAIDAQPTSLLAWQGLASFYEKTENWDRYVETQSKLADLAVESHGVTKCAEALQKILKTQRTLANATQVLNTLQLYLPGSRYYSLLSSLPSPDNTNPTASTTHESEGLVHNSLPILQQLLDVRESEEKATIDREVEKRRQRLTTTTSASDTRKNVMLEVMKKSDIPNIYQQILEHHHAPDDLRREIEAKLLQYHYDLLLAVPSPFTDALESAQSEITIQKDRESREAAASDKDKHRATVEKLAKDIVTLRISLPLAWTIVLEWRDPAKDADFWDTYTLKRFAETFPESGLSRLLIVEKRVPDPDKEETQEEKPEGPSSGPSQADAPEVDSALEATRETSVLAHVLSSDFYGRFQDWEMVADISQSGLDLLGRLERDIGRRSPGLAAALETNLAVALTHINPPQQHTRALRLLNKLLQQSPHDLRCLMARGYVYEYAERWQDAYEHFVKVFEETSDQGVKAKARAEQAWCLGNVPERVSGALDELHEVASLGDQSPDIDRNIKARSWWRYGQCLRRLRDEEHKTAAFVAFNTSILRDNTYAASFTSLGFHYLEDITPADEESASRCFQRAFELDEREEVAARMLAESYSESEDWDLVETIARRLVRNLYSSEGRYAVNERPAAGSLAAQKYGWAWKAIGVADLKSKRFEKAIPSLQQAVRGLQLDPDCWTQLAIAYRGAGKHVASLKTLLRVRQLDPEDWHSQYLLADIQRQIGLYEEALEAFHLLSSSQPDQLVVRVAIAETQLSLAVSQIRSGFVQRAISSLRQCIGASSALLKDEQAARRIAWKLLGDAMCKLAQLNSKDDEAIRSQVQTLNANLLEEGIDQANSSLTVVTSKGLAAAAADKPLASVCQAFAVLCYSMRMLLYPQADDGAGSAWYDLAYALYSLQDLYEPLKLLSDLNTVRMESISCVKAALQKEPLNGVFWNLLGVLSADFSAKLSQHALIRACELNVRSAVPWTNLALFYISHEDYELANKALLRAQVVDPDYPQAWLGQAVLAHMHGDLRQADVLIQHAATLANGTVPEADLSASWATFRSNKHDLAASSFVKAHFSAARMLNVRRKPSQTKSALHLHGILSERLGYIGSAIQSFEEALTLLEAEYETNDTPEVEHMYIIASLSLARALIADARHAEALSTLETVHALITSESGEKQGTPIFETQSHMLQALAAYHLDDISRCFASLENGRESLGRANMAADSPHQKQEMANEITLLLCRILCSLGSEDHLAEAERQLLDNIFDAESGIANLQVITTLAAMAIVTSNEELLDAALAEIVKLPVDQQVQQDRSGEITYLLVAQAKMRKDRDAAVNTLAHALHASPSARDGRESLSEALAALNLGQSHLNGLANDEQPEGSNSIALHRAHTTPWSRTALREVLET